MKHNGRQLEQPQKQTTFEHHKTTTRNFIFFNFFVVAAEPTFPLLLSLNILCIVKLEEE